jgi:hypothetical protein
MPRLSQFLVAISVSVLACLSESFAPTHRYPVSFPTQWTTRRLQLLSMAGDGTPEGEPENKKAEPTSGTYYDDEVEPAPKVGISNSMKERLMREASSGLDSEKKQTNVLLYVILGVAVLVLLGGQGILF